MTQPPPPGPYGPHGPHWPPAALPPETGRRRARAKPRRGHWWPWAAVGVGAVMLLAGIVGVTSPGKVTPTPTQNRPGVPSGVDPDTWTARPHTVPGVLTEQAPAQPAQSGPRTTFSAGTYEVGADIEPGKYKTTGPAAGGSCYWARLKNTDGGFDAIIANGNTEGPATVTIAKSDAAFETTDCTWTKAG